MYQLLILGNLFVIIPLNFVVTPIYVPIDLLHLVLIIIH